MRRYTTLFTLALILYSIFSRVAAAPATTSASSNGGGGEESALIDIKANLVYPHKVNDTLTVLCLVGRFAAQHNGAVITADSAVRYGDDKLECFGNVLINKNTTYAYANRADYDGVTNIASLYAPLVKVVDQDVTMYTYNFRFNTLDNIGYYWGGGVTIKSAAGGASTKDDVMESSVGYYYADTKQVIGVDDVELSGEEYLMKSDSVLYDMPADKAYFYRNTNIWNGDSDFIFGDRGLYDKRRALYSVTHNGYILTKDQEIWGDTLEYYRVSQEAILRHNIQIDDTTNKSIAFGNFAHYWRDVEQMMLTRDPVIINYDTQNQSDTLFIRSDTIMLFSYPNGTGPIIDSAALAEAEERQRLLDQMRGVEDTQSDLSMVDSVSSMPSIDPLMGDPIAADSMLLDSMAIDPLEEAKGVAQVEEVLEEELEDVAEKEGVDEVAEEVEDAPAAPTKRELNQLKRLEKAQIKIDAQRARDYRDVLKRIEKVSERIDKQRAKGRNIYSDSMLLVRIQAEAKEFEVDSTDVVETESAGYNDKPVVEYQDSVPERDSLYRVVKFFRNVRSYRSDFQMICDSLVAISYDTIMRLYHDPVIWSDQNQIVSNQANVYTLNGDVDYVDFIGEPIMSSQVVPDDTTHFNQVSGKEMRAMFENNEIKRNNVNGNVQTIYFMQDSDTQDINTIAYVESGSATFLIEDRQLDGIIYRSQPTYTFAPLSMLSSAKLSLYLPAFEWYASERPTRETTFNREIKPSQREEMSALERPIFPIQEGINEKRAKLVESGAWRDREDKVSAEATAWMKSLGFTPGEPRPEGSGFEL